jgi:hypothetical protein
MRRQPCPATFVATAGALDEPMAQGALGIVEIRKRVTIRPADLASAGSHGACSVDGSEQGDSTVPEGEALAALEPDLVLHRRPI